MAAGVQVDPSLHTEISKIDEAMQRTGLHGLAGLNDDTESEDDSDTEPKEEVQEAEPTRAALELGGRR